MGFPESLYRTPGRVYLVLAILSVIGIASAFKLPISLFPNSTKPKVTSCVPIELSPEVFLRGYGRRFEERFRAIKMRDLEVERVQSTYSPGEACYNIDFKWGGDVQQAIREVETTGAAILAGLPDSYRDGAYTYVDEENSGFLAISFYSPERNLTELYRILEPALSPKLTGLPDAGEVELHNPARREVIVELKPEAMAALDLFPSDVGSAILKAFDAYSGGSLTIEEQKLTVDFPRAVEKFSELGAIPIPTANGRMTTLGDIARIDLAVPVDDGRIAKTSGVASIILFAVPKPGGNVKAMAESILAIVEQTLKTLPKDIEYKILVDPSEFIRSSVNNVSHEVILAAALAVLILFIFIGSLKNVATAAIEIPLSIVLAFIMMRIAGMNLNLISLGGLALSAGMNVDASVVVMENIFRHFDRHRGKTLSYDDRVSIISEAVKEVRFSVIASTIASLVVFIPLAFTSELTYAILGDLAKAVVFSHGFSAVVALILVPTVRLHIMKNGPAHGEHGKFEHLLLRLEEKYSLALGRFLASPKMKIGTYGGLALIFAALLFLVVPRLPKEIIGKPDTDWVMLGINTRGNTLMKQMESETEVIERKVLDKFGDKVRYTFTQIRRPNRSTIMLRLKNKADMDQMLKDVEDAFPSTPDVSFWYDSWNPAELPIPNPPDFKVTIRGQDQTQMAEAARDLQTELKERGIFDRVNVNPSAALEENIRLRPRHEQWLALAGDGRTLRLSDLADLTRTATQGKSIGTVDIEDETGITDGMKIRMRYPMDFAMNAEELGAFPIGVHGKIIPLKAIAQVTREQVRPSILREDGFEMFVLEAYGKQGQRKKTEESTKKAEELLKDWDRLRSETQKKRLALVGSLKDPSADATEALTISGAAVKDGVAASLKPTLQLEDAKKELTDALHQLAFAISLSIGLIFLTMIFQFGSVMNALLVLVAVPLGFIGVVISLFVFQSTLSLNSLLGVILLNGLAVANSIILVDFLQRKVKEGVAPRIAAVEVARSRMRPILMTSLTTGLGMLPIAVGIGEGGKILQPLGIAVAGGLGFSMVTTLFIVPALQVSWIEYRESRLKKARA